MAGRSTAEDDAIPSSSHVSGFLSFCVFLSLFGAIILLDEEGLSFTIGLDSCWTGKDTDCSIEKIESLARTGSIYIVQAKDLKCSVEDTSNFCTRVTLT